jgi:lipoprotein-anchoring transpeptidase ErfK/SrfK
VRRRAALLITLSSCGVAGASPATAALPVAPAGGERTGVCLDGLTRTVPVGDQALVVVAKGQTLSFTRPNGTRRHVFRRINQNGVPTVFNVHAVIRNRACKPGWYRVQLPVRPNGAKGYVRARDVELYTVETRIEVDISERRVVFYRRGKTVMTVTAAVGSPATPTPTGRFYVNQRLLSNDPGGPFGPGGLGISAFSPVLTGWTQGGPIAIHGTNRPESIGQNVTNGCLRVPNRVLRRLFRATPAGTPVIIRA